MSTDSARARPSPWAANQLAYLASDVVLSPGGDGPRTSVIVVHYQSGALLGRCLASVVAQKVAVDIVVVDNSPNDGEVLRLLPEFPQMRRVTASVNLGFAAGANLGAQHANAEYLLFLNPDARLAEGCIHHLESALDRDRELAVCGPIVHTESTGRSSHGGTIDIAGSPVRAVPGVPPLYVTGCALMTRKDTFRQLGGFDGRFFMFVEDVDYCWRALLRGLDVASVPGAGCTHVGGSSAPGGYETSRGFSTTAFRLLLRERNTLAMILKCAPRTWLACMVPLYIAQAFVTAVSLALSRQGRAATTVLRALRENLHWAASTRSARMEARPASPGADRVVRSRLHRGMARAALFRRVGIPRVQ